MCCVALFPPRIDRGGEAGLRPWGAAGDCNAGTWGDQAGLYLVVVAAAVVVTVVVVVAAVV